MSSTYTFDPLERHCSCLDLQVLKLRVSGSFLRKDPMAQKMPAFTDEQSYRSTSNGLV